MPVEFGSLKMYTVEEIAKKLKVSSHMVYEYIKEGGWMPDVSARNIRSRRRT